MTSFCMSLPDLADMKHTFIPCPSRTKETQACLQAPSPSLGSKDSALRPCDGFCYHQGLDHSTGPLCGLCTAMPHHRLKLACPFALSPEKNQHRASTDDSGQAASGLRVTSEADEP